MRLQIYFSIVCGLCLCYRFAKAQTPPRQEVDIDLFVQELFQVQDENINYEDLYEILFQFYRNPLDLNNASREELQSLYILSELQINQLIKHLQLNGKLLNLYELQAIPSFDQATIQRLLPFVTVEEAAVVMDSRGLWQRMLEERNHYLIVRTEQVLEEKVGYTEAIPDSRGELPQRYTGAPLKQYGRYRWARTRDFSFGFTYEKDAGEQFRWDPAGRKYGFDFWSFHAQVYQRGRWKAIALGDYNISFGQGLVFSPGFAAGKGGEAVSTVKRNSLGIRPYTSVLEFNYFRGAAATYRLFPKLDLTLFGSRRRASGSVTVEAEGQSEDDFIASLLNTGFHRTPSELSRRATIQQTDWGGNLQSLFNHNRSQIGLNFLQTRYDRPLNRELQVYNQFDFSGRYNSLTSVYGSHVWQNFQFFGEFAHNLQRGNAGVLGLLASLSAKADVAVVYRNYANDFFSIYGNAFGERNRNSNEEGLYLGLKIKPNRRWTFNAYSDQFRSPWLAYLVDAPVVGQEYLLRISWQPVKKVNLYAQFRSESKGRNQISNEGPIDYVVTSRRRNLLINLDWALDEQITLKSRVQSSDFTQPGRSSRGFAIVQDLQYEYRKISIAARYAIFDTDDFENRQYVFEKDVLYAFAFPTYFGRGSRYYLLLRYGLGKRIDLWVKWSRSTFRDQETISSGLEQIRGNTRSEIKLQVRYKIG